MNQTRCDQEEPSRQRFAKLSLVINKFVLSLPLLAVFFLLFPDNPIIARNTEKSLGMMLIGSGLLSYPLVFAVGRTIAKQRYERGEYLRSVFMSWLPAICIILIIVGYVVS